MRILYPLTSSPWGGGNQFLKALSRCQEISTQESTSTVLVNSHHIQFSLTLLRHLLSPTARIIHRVDGPISLVRGYGALLDRLIYLLSSLVADGVIFQSQWSRIKSSGFFPFKLSPKHHEVILNGADSYHFYLPECKPLHQFNVICTSWSSSPRKGVSYFVKLSKEPCFQHVNFIFVGNYDHSVDFSNLHIYPPMNSHDLGIYLRDSHAYVTFSEDDPCSNSLLEAVACGCVPFALDSGGNPEILDLTGGFVFSNYDQCVSQLLNFISSKNTLDINPRLIVDSSEKYYLFDKFLHTTRRPNSLYVRLISFLLCYLLLQLHRILSRFFSL